MSIDITAIAETVNRVMQDFGDEVVEAVKEASEEVAKACVVELKRTSPKQTGEYRKSWKCKREIGTGGRLWVWVVYNENHYQLTHLLENGHPKKGGLVAQPKRHIGPARENAEVLFYQKALEAIGRVTG